MFANVPLIKKIALSWQIIPVYFVVVEVTYSVNHYILFNENETSLRKYLSLLLFNPLSLMTIITHLRSMFRSPGYVPIPFTHYNDSSKLPDVTSSNRNDSNDNSRINFNINEIINDCSTNNSKNCISSLKYWLNSIDLINYYPNFINAGMYDISDLIEKMKSYQTKLKYETLENNLKMRKPGHIYRILCRLEVDANLIDNKVTKFLLKNNKIFNKNGLYIPGGFDNNDKNMHLLISQDYQCFGCCKANKKFSNLVKNDLKSFLKRYGLLNFYQNFYHNGFELIEYVILQMYGGYPINDEILENCFHVYEEDQRKKILKAIVSEMKKINEFLISDEYNNNENMDYAKYENIIFCNEQKGEESKIKINNGKNENCLIF